MLTLVIVFLKHYQLMLFLIGIFHIGLKDRVYLSLFGFNVPDGECIYLLFFLNLSLNVVGLNNNNNNKKSWGWKCVVIVDDDAVPSSLFAAVCTIVESAGIACFAERAGVALRVLLTVYNGAWSQAGGKTFPISLLLSIVSLCQVPSAFPTGFHIGGLQNQADTSELCLKIMSMPLDYFRLIKGFQPA